MSIEEKIIPGIDIKLPNTIRVEFIKLDLIVEISLSFRVFDLDPAIPKSRPIKTYMSPGLIWNIFLSSLPFSLVNCSPQYRYFITSWDLMTDLQNH